MLTRTSTLLQLILTTTLTPDQLNAIRTQLRLLAPKDEPAPTPDGGHSPFPPAVAAVLSPQQPQHYASLAPPPPPTAPHVIEPPAAPVGVPGIDQGLIAQLAGLAGGDLSSLLASTEAASRARGASPAPEASSKTEDKADIGPDPVVAEYDQALVALDVNLTNPDMLKWRPEGWSFLYARLGTQCKQCGLRFFATRQGKKNMDVSLISSSQALYSLLWFSSPRSACEHSPLAQEPGPRGLLQHVTRPAVARARHRPGRRAVLRCGAMGARLVRRGQKTGSVLEQL